MKKTIPHPHLGDAKFFVQLPQIQLLFILKNQPYWIPKRLQDISTPYFSTPSSILATTWTLQTMNSSNHVFLNHELLNHELLNHELFNHELLNPLELWIFSTMNSGLEESRVEVWCWKVKCWNVLSLLGRSTFQSPNGRKIHSLKNYLWFHEVAQEEDRKKNTKDFNQKIYKYQWQLSMKTFSLTDFHKVTRFLIIDKNLFLGNSLLAIQDYGNDVCQSGSSLTSCWRFNFTSYRLPTLPMSRQE